MGNSKNPPSPESDQLITRFRQQLDAVCRREDTLCVAYSGGLDSTVLLHLAASCAHGRLAKAVHVHHGLSPNADTWAAFCADVCQDWQIPLEVRHLDLHFDEGLGVEETARRARHEVFQSLSDCWVLLAHHQDDQAETLLLNLVRGAGVLGVAGMPSLRGNLFRPLLGCSRSELEAYARLHQLRWLEDESNDDTRYSRNFLRREVLPLLASRFSSVRERLAASTQQFAHAHEVLADVARMDGALEYPLPIAFLQELSLPRALNVLAEFLRQHGIRPPSSARLQEMLRQAREAKGDRQVAISVGHSLIRRYRGALWVDTQVRAPVEARWNRATAFPWGEGCIRFISTIGESGIRADYLADSDDPVGFRCRRPGDRFRTDMQRPRRSLIDLMREAGIPPWIRDRLPVFVQGEHLLWVAGLGVNAEYRAQPGESAMALEFDGVSW